MLIAPERVKVSTDVRLNRDPCLLAPLPDALQVRQGRSAQTVSDRAAVPRSRGSIGGHGISDAMSFPASALPCSELRQGRC
jgi:hypothetical protein